MIPSPHFPVFGNPQLMIINYGMLPPNTPYTECALGTSTSSWCVVHHLRHTEGPYTVPTHSVLWGPQEVVAVCVDVGHDQLSSLHGGGEGGREE